MSNFTQSKLCSRKLELAPALQISDPYSAPLHFSTIFLSRESVFFTG
ncbi:hypothetical protein DES53_108119 [Roseimicrobium gellanilyticum]|uniref:Uncharacterized protein n=1 Tax=Roseimicrobium gellanilyticum TaxID=748857 RepID=A0A366HD77_9BACT|nr:hypothetical protein DES53_108119 [Roseimicrobium gellanilyticum]